MAWYISARTLIRRSFTNLTGRLRPVNGNL